MNPVVLLDEIDKLGSDYRGDPASALLEVLDPAQNHTFRDHYLEIELDLSDVLFLATANVAETIPPALLDRMELVRLDGYTEDEKVAIARNHLVPRQIDLAGLDADEVSIDDEALRVDRNRVHPRGRRSPARACHRQDPPQGDDTPRRGDPADATLEVGPTGPEGVPGPSPLHARVSRAHRRSRRRDRPRCHRCRRRRALHRGDRHGRRAPSRPHRPAR